MTSKTALDKLCASADLDNCDFDKIDKWSNVIRKDLELLEIIKNNPEVIWWVCCYENAYEMIIDRKGFMLDFSIKEIVRQFNKIKEWLEK